jgi:hypothetical protein
LREIVTECAKSCSQCEDKNPTRLG